FLRWGGANLPLVNGVYPPLECIGYNWSLRPALNHGYWNAVASTPTATGIYDMLLWNRTYTNYVGGPWVGIAATNSLPSTGAAAGVTVIPFASITTPGNPPLTVGMNVLGFGIPAGATITGVTLTTITLSAPTTAAIPAGQYIDFFTASGGYAALTVMKDVNGTGGWAMEATCPCNAAFPPPPKPVSKRYAYDASISGFFNYATVQFGTALPIELISFTAEHADNGNLCKWVTASEINNDYFILERSYDGTNFTKIAQINGFGAGTTTETREYEFTDEDPCNSIAYYRLMQVDIDGEFSTSDVVALNCMKSKDDLSVYPNPAHHNISYSFNEEADGVINVQILDVYGKVVTWERFTTQRGLNTLNSSIESLSSGVYYLKLERMDKTGTVRQVRFVKN
nr:T9SS type A sorting domain-containing protein [Bacteroidia bacterium]